MLSLIVNSNLVSNTKGDNFRGEQKLISVVQSASALRIPQIIDPFTVVFRGAVGLVRLAVLFVAFTSREIRAAKKIIRYFLSL